MSMKLVFTQILVILLYVAVGYIAGKVKLILPEQRKYLTRLCSNLILPFTILSATSLNVTDEQFASLGIALGLFFLFIGGASCLSLLYHRVRGSDKALRAVTTSLISYPNCTFLGLPLCTALFGEIAILYNAASMVAFNALFFTLQYSLFTGEKFNPKNLLTPPLVSTVIMIAMLALRIHLPAPVQTVASGIGGMITPLSLMIIGVMLSENRMLDILREKRAYLITLLRNLAVPILAMLTLSLMPMDAQSKLCVLVYLACPCGTLSSIYAIQTDMEPELASRTVLMSTVFFAASLPIMIALGSRMFGL